MQISLVAFALLMKAVLVIPQPPAETEPSSFSIQELQVFTGASAMRGDSMLYVSMEIVIDGGKPESAGYPGDPVLLANDQNVQTYVQRTGTFDELGSRKSPKLQLSAQIPFGEVDEPRLLLSLPGLVPERCAERTDAQERIGPGDAEKNDVAPAEAPGEFAMNLNKYFREVNPLRSTRCGPEGALEIIAISRNLDLAAGWVLFEYLNKRGGDSSERLVIVPLEDRSVAATDDVAKWISSLAREANPNAPEFVLPALGKTLRFSAVAGMQKWQEGRFSGGPAARGLASSSYATADEAIRDALTPVYRFSPVEQALADLRGDVPGVRRAALAGVVDRLTEQQARVLIEFAHSGSVDRQLEVASYLNQIPGPDAILALKELSLGENEKVAAGALAGLSNSLNILAESAMSEIWEAGQQRPGLRSLAATEMAASVNDRWVPLLTAYVDEFLELAVQGYTAGHTPEQLQNVLKYLADRKPLDLERQIRARIEAIHLTPFQDILISQLRSWREPATIETIRRVVTARLQAGLISQAVEDAGMDLRDPAWTELFLSDYQRKRTARTDQNTLRCVLACATPEQLTGIAARTGELDDSAIDELLRYLAAIEHPAFRMLAGQQLKLRGPSSINAIQVLGADASEESLSLLMESARQHVAELEGTRDASVDGQHYLQVLLDYLATFSHPECRRLINQLCRDRNPWVRELARERYRNAVSRSPAMRFLSEENEAREKGDLKVASRALEAALQEDPFLPEAWLRRSSERMHAGEFDAAFADLQHASELSPESVEVTSMMSLVLIRLGKVEEGLKTTDDLVKLAPEDDFALYNGACAYSRAAERPDVPLEMKQQYLARAIELLKKTNETGFTDFSHLAKDVDLEALHQHSEWNAVVEGARANATKSGVLPE